MTIERDTSSTRLLFAALLLALALAAPAAAQFQPWQGASLLDDPSWRAHFLGTYGFLSGAEPEIGATERAVLLEVIELMRVNPRAAAAMLEKSMKPDGSAALDFILANLDYQNGQLDEAVTYYGRALEKFPDFRRAHKNLGLLRVQQGDHAKSLEHLTRAVELGDRDGRTYGLIGYCYIQSEQYLAAEQAYRNAVLLQPGTRDWKLGLARSLLAMKKYRDAVALFADLIEANPEDATSWILQANAYIGLDEPAAAAVNLETVRMLGKAQASTLVLLGDIYMNAGMPDLAASVYLEVIESDREGASFATAQRAAELLIRVNAFDESQKILAGIRRRFGGKLAEDEELKLLTLEAKVARAQGRDKEAAKVLGSIVERDGTRGDALLELAKYHAERKEIEKALLLIERAENLEAWEYRALLDHAQVLVGERDYAKAAEVLRRALKIQSEPRVERFLARIEEAVRS